MRKFRLTQIIIYFFFTTFHFDFKTLSFSVVIKHKINKSKIKKENKT